MHIKNIRNMNSMVKFSKFTPEKELYDKFEGFFFRLVWRETLFDPRIVIFTQCLILANPLFPYSGQTGSLCVCYLAKMLAILIFSA